MTENYKPNIAYRGEPVPPEEVNLEKIANILYEDRKLSEENTKIAEWKWRNPFTT
jgi:hypothetical protein